METTQQNKQFIDLPMEMKIHIFKYLKLSDKKNVRLVCHIWSELISSTMKFRTVLNDNCFHEILKSNVQFEKLTVYQLSKTAMPCSFQRNNFMSSLRKLSVREDKDGVGISQINLLKLFRLSSDVVKMTIETASLKNYGRVQWDFLSFGNIKLLKIKISKYEKNIHKTVLDLLCLGKFPLLLIFSIQFICMSRNQLTRMTYPVLPLNRIYFGALKFIQRHKYSLKFFNFGEPSELEELNIAAHFEYEIPRDMANEFNIEYLSLFLGVCGHRNLIWLPRGYMICSITNLKSLHLFGLLSDDVQVLVFRNRKTIESLSWIPNILIDVPPPPSFDMANLEGNRTLKTLHLSTHKVRNFRSIPSCLTELIWASPISLEDLFWLSRNMNNLKCLTFQDEKDLLDNYLLRIPHVTVEVVKNILVLPKLVNLKLFCLVSAVDINEFCSRELGLSLRTEQSFTITIDRKNFNPLP